MFFLLFFRVKTRHKGGGTTFVLQHPPPLPNLPAGLEALGAPHFARLHGGRLHGRPAAGRLVGAAARHRSSEKGVLDGTRFSGEKRAIAQYSMDHCS